jgi:hypothetical protein
MQPKCWSNKYIVEASKDGFILDPLEIHSVFVIILIMCALLKHTLISIQTSCELVLMAWVGGHATYVAACLLANVAARNHTLYSSQALLSLKNEATPPNLLSVTYGCTSLQQNWLIPTK